MRQTTPAPSPAGIDPDALLRLTPGGGRTLVPGATVTERIGLLAAILEAVTAHPPATHDRGGRPLNARTMAAEVWPHVRGAVVCEQPRTTFEQVQRRPQCATIVADLLDLLLVASRRRAELVAQLAALDAVAPAATVLLADRRQPDVAPRRLARAS